MRKRRRAACGPTFCIFVSLLSGCARHYRVDGLVLKVDPGRRTMLVSHKDISGYMKAMAMPFRVRRPSELERLAPGSRIRFELVVKRRESFARKIRARSEGVETVALSEPLERLAIGAVVPDFVLTDQSGGTVRLSDFRGSVVAVDFIYTRCPLPDVCPRLSAHFARLQRRFGANLKLLSVSIDPQYDTPEVLAGYAKIWKANPESWHFLTGDVREIQRVAVRFGMVYWPEEGTLTHASETAIISRDGRLAALVEGSRYLFGQLEDLVALQLEGK